MPTIPMTPVESSQVAAVGYDPSGKVLAVQFKAKAGPGSIYHYADVPPDVYQGMLAAESCGKFFGANIRGKFEFTKQEQSDGE